MTNTGRSPAAISEEPHCKTLTIRFFSLKGIHLSISIVLYDLDETGLSQCLKSLNNAITQPRVAKKLSSWTLTIVDNGKHGESLNQFDSANTHIIGNAKNVGYGAAHNQAMMCQKSDFHLILNPDVILAADYFSLTLGLMASNTDVVLAGPTGNTSCGTNAYLCKRYPSLLVLFIRGLAQKRISTLFRKKIARYECHDLPDSEVSDVELLSGCCMFARTKALQDIGGFDERFFLYFEDFDLSLRMQEAGRVVFFPASNIVHFGGNSATKGLHHVKLFVISALRFFQKHGWKIV